MNTRKRLTDVVKEKIIELVTRGGYQPGDKIPTEAELSKRFECSRSTVREAIKTFNYLGILESKSALGTFVCSTSEISKQAIIWSILLREKDIKHLLELREVFERRGIEMLVSNEGKTKNKILLSLEHIIIDMRHANENHDFESLIEKDYLYHLRIIESSGNPLFVNIYEILRSLMKLEISIALHIDKSKIIEHHEKIYQKIRLHDLDGALKAYSQHMKHVYKKVLEERNLKKV
jgi:DNA-binding FadR family transcriptional regulator